MATNESSSSFSKRVLTKEDLDKLPNDIRNKYEEFFSEFLEMKALYETQRSNLGKSLGRRSISALNDVESLRAKVAESRLLIACLQWKIFKQKSR